MWPATLCTLFPTRRTSDLAATVSLAIVATNTGPVALDDSFSVNEDATLAVPAGGVLSNDSDADGDALLALLVSGPAHAAAFSLNPDGSFSYMPAPNYFGPDSFTYRANDGLTKIGRATGRQSVKA